MEVMGGARETTPPPQTRALGIELNFLLPAPNGTQTNSSSIIPLSSSWTLQFRGMQLEGSGETKVQGPGPPRSPDSSAQTT